MNILLPLNTNYLKDRYLMSSGLLKQIVEEVLPNIVARLTADSRITAIEIITNETLILSGVLNDKVDVTKYDIGILHQQQDVTKALLDCRVSSGEMVINLNPLYPFVRVASLFQAYESVRDGNARSAFGSIRSAVGLHERDLISELDQGVFTVFRAQDFGTTAARLNPPVDAVGLAAVELICLRTLRDLELYELVINSGYSL